MSKQISTTLTDHNRANLELLKKAINSSGTSINNGMTTNSSMINFIINEYFDVFGDTSINRKIVYEQEKFNVKQGLEKNGKRSLDSKANQILQLVAENYYLTMAASKALVINHDDLQNVESIFKDWTLQHAMHTAMRNQVNDDAHRNLLLNQTKIRKGHSHEN